MLRCSVVRGKCSSSAAAVDQVAAGARTQRDPCDRRLALAGGAVAGARGEIDRRCRDRLGDRLLLLALADVLRLLGLLLDRVEVLVGLLGRCSAGRRPPGRCRPRGALPERTVSPAPAQRRPSRRPAARRRRPEPPGRPPARRPRPIPQPPGPPRSVPRGRRRPAPPWRARGRSARPTPLPPGRPPARRPRPIPRSPSPPRRARRAVGPPAPRRSAASRGPRVCPRLPSDLYLEGFAAVCATCGCSGPA